MGFYELFINGKKITKGKLSSYISNPDDVLYYDDYDITSYLHDGKNTIGFLLGNGMLNCIGGYEWNFDKASYRSAPKVALALISEGELVFEADGNFKTHESPIRFDDLRAGEHYDANFEIEGWNLPDFDDSAWQKAFPAVTPKGEKRLNCVEPILISQELPVQSIQKTEKGYLYDFGVNFAGICRLKIKGEKGQCVKMTFGEIVLDGELNLENISYKSTKEGYLQCNSYVLKGEGEETYEPYFTYHGFRYVEVEGITEEQAVSELLTYCVMHSAVEKRGDFRCSDGMLNQLQENIQRSDLSNLYYFITDCPHREKNGWTGDVTLSAEQFALNFGVEKCLEEWLFNVRKAQRANGEIPSIVPSPGWGYFDWGTGPNWDASLIECGYVVYKYTGNKRVLFDNIEAIERYLKFLETKVNEEGLIAFGLWDWCQIGSDNFENKGAPLDITDTLRSMDMCRKAALFAEVLGLEGLRRYASDFAKELLTAFRKKYVKNGKMTSTFQTALASALYFHAVEPERKNVFAQLLEAIERANGHFDVGILGARVLFRVLSDFGQAELAYRLITQPSFPSYAYHIRLGETTLHESFHLLKDGALRKANGEKIDSLNHHFWGDVSAWMISYIGGIKVNEAGDDADRVKIAPCFLKNLQFAESYYNHTKGRIFVRWERADGQRIRLFIEIPEGVKATLKTETLDRPIGKGKTEIFL